MKYNSSWVLFDSPCLPDKLEANVDPTFGRTGNKPRDGLLQVLATHVITANERVLQRKQHSCSRPIHARSATAYLRAPTWCNTDSRSHLIPRATHYAAMRYNQKLSTAQYSIAKSSHPRAKGESKEPSPQSQKENGKKERKANRVGRPDKRHGDAVPTSKTPIQGTTREGEGEQGNAATEDVTAVMKAEHWLDAKERLSTLPVRFEAVDAAGGEDPLFLQGMGAAPTKKTTSSTALRLPARGIRSVSG
ncbi:hypothetical protein B0H13DRAFT_1923715 [Mycena leptocephala]|nr:hypothetical protein B0H13DRAFT_1923715 [Mycena leptocephala]